MTELDLFNQALGEVGAYRITLASSFVASGATAANPVVVTTMSDHGYSSDDLVFMSAMDEMTEVNGRIFKIAVLTTTTFQLVGEDGTEYTAETTGGLVQKLSSGDEVTEVFDRWPVVRREVLEEHSWNCATTYYRLARLDTALTITAITQASPAVVTTSGAHGLSQGDQVYVSTVVGMVEVNGRYFTVGTVPTTTTFQLSGIDSTEYTAYSSGGTAEKALTPLKPDFGFAYRYTAPSDLLRMLNIALAGYESDPWERVGSEIYTDVGITVPIRYTRRVTDPEVFPSKLFSYMAARLAERICWKITGSRSQAEDQRKIADDARRTAMRTDGQEQSASEFAETSWITARR